MSIHKLNKRKFNKKFKVNSKTKITFFVYLLIFLYSFIITGCSNTDSKEALALEDETGLVTELNQWFPALWINGLDYTYQPMYGNKTKLSLVNRTSNSVYFSAAGLPFTIESNDGVDVNYLITKVGGDIVESGSVKPRIVQSDQSHIFDIIPKDFSVYTLNETYNLEVTLTINGQEAYYYLDLYVSQTDGNSKIVNKVYDYLKQDQKANSISFLNVPRFWINVIEDGTAIVRSEFTGATRLDEGFDYIDYIKLFSVDIINGSISQDAQYMVDKQRYIYDLEEKGWLLGAQLFIGDDTSVFNPYIRKTLTTENDNYQVIYSDYELLSYNKKNEELYEIYRLDTFDSDYIYDEYQNHKLKILNVEENGDVYFVVMGYIHDHSDVTQKTGISFYKYVDHKLIQIDFLEKEGTIKQLDAYLSHNTYYNRSFNKLYFFEKQVLYSFDLVNNSFTYIDAYLKANFNNNSGVLSWQGHENKFNGTVYEVNLNNENIEILDLNQIGIYKRLLGDSDHYIFVGDYYVEDTYEALNGQIIYPFAQVKVYDFNGNILASYDHLDYGENIFFSDVYFDAVSNQWKNDLIQRQIKSESVSKNSRINFVQTNEPIVLDNFDLLSTDRTNEFKPVEVEIFEAYKTGLIKTKDKEQDIIFLNRPSIHSDSQLNIQFESYPKKDVYKIVDSKGDVWFTSTFISALQTAKEKRDYKIYFSDYLNDGTSADELMFDSTSLLTNQYLDQTLIVSQRPELPRGCEVASLSILLDYYLEEAPGKMELAEELKTSTIEYKIIDGFVNYSNMHYEFAGSQTDTSKPGLGVYIEPIRKLAKEYTDHNPTNITGASFEQLLTFVSNKQPVLIIIPNRYQAVADYGKEVWKTTSGYMEVTYQEHSVVVMGFDENYVYYSDPSKGIIDKKSLQSFRNAWESMGNQGLVILEYN